MEQQHQEPYVYSNFQDGIAYDVFDELIPLVSKNQYIEAINLRHNSTQRSRDALEKINGEELIYPLIDNKCIGGTGAPLDSNYTCIGAESCNGYLFEIWANRIYNGSNFPPIVRINGKIVLESNLFLADAFHYFNTHKDESVLGGIVFATDGEHNPYDFNILDLLTNSGIIFATGQFQNSGATACTQKYFTAFAPSYITQELFTPADHPQFIELGLVSAGQGGLNIVPNSVYAEFGSGGLAVGSYLYSISYVNTTGDQTNWSAPTPLIDVVGNLSANATPYPFTKTYGLPIASISQYGIHTRFRITNLANYQYIQVLRLAYNNGYPNGTPTTLQVIAQISITPQQIGIVDFFDMGATATSTLTNLDVSENLSIIDAANSNRFVNLRKYLGGITYASKDISADVTFTDASGTPCYAKSTALGIVGHKDPYNSCYFKHYQLGEQYAPAIQPYDNTFAPFYAIPVPVPSTNPAFPNAFQFPNRRDLEQQTGAGSTIAALAPVIGIGKCYEVFDLSNGAYKTNLASMHSVFPGDSAGYAPLRPVGDLDSNESGWNFVINDGVFGDNVTINTYRPQMFSPTYYATGLAIKGVSVPSSVAAFGVVRSERANRVVAQGLGFWNLSFDTMTSSPVKDNTDFNFYSPDFESGIVDPQSIIDNLASGRYAVQFVSPLGFGSEIYSFYHDGSKAPPDFMIDMISYARVIYENGVFEGGAINNDSSGGGDTPLTNGINGYTTYGYWRNLRSSGGGSSIFGAPNFGNNEFTITNMLPVTTSSGRQTYYKITIGSNNLYAVNTLPAGSSFNSADARLFHEPVYVVNIIDMGASIPNQNQNTYIDTGTLIKVKSIIGQSGGNLTQQYYLVDERAGDVTTSDSSLNRFLYVQDPNTGLFSQWIDVTAKTDTQKHTIFGQIPSVYGGAYTVAATQIGNSSLNNLYTITFSANTLVTVTNPTDTPIPVPVNGALIYANYDNTEPILMMGGDSFLGESSWALVDNISQDGGEDNTTTGNNEYVCPMPYYTYHMNANIHLYDKTSEQNFFTLTIALVRQHILMFTAECRTALPYDFCAPAPNYIDRVFPNVNYIIKPLGWDTGTNASTYVQAYGTAPQYNDDYPEMITGTSGTNSFTDEIRYGGFRFTQNDINTVIDYAHESNQFTYFSKPAVGFVEQNYFPTRIIWSDEKLINSQNIPGLQTFPPLNFFDISDDTGAINFLWDGQTSKYGNNIYAFTDSGICLTLTDQFLMTAGDSGQLTTITPTSGQQGILQEQWISKIIGIPYQMWRSKAEYNNILFFTNKQSVYRFDGNEPVDVGRQNYYSRIYGDVLSNIDGQNDIGLAGVFDPTNKEYWITVKLNQGIFTTNTPITGNYSLYTYNVLSNITVTVSVTQGSIFYVQNNSTVNTIELIDAINSTPIGLLLPLSFYQVAFDGQTNYTLTLLGNVNDLPFGKDMTFGYYDSRVVPQINSQNDQIPSSWNGQYLYDYEKYCAVNNTVYGMKQGGTYQVGVENNYTFNGEPITASLLQATSGGENATMAKEFIRIRVNSDNAPTTINFFDDLSEYLDGAIQATASQTIVGRYGFECYVPRRITMQNQRMQGRVLVYNILHNLASPFIITNIGVKYKNLK